MFFYEQLLRTFHFLRPKNLGLRAPLFGINSLRVQKSLRLSYRAKLHYTDIGYGHVVQYHQRTSSQQFYNKFATSQRQSSTSRHAKTLGCGKFLSVGGEFVVQQIVELL